MTENSRKLNRRQLLASGTVGLAGAGIVTAAAHAVAGAEDSGHNPAPNRSDNVVKPNTHGGPVNVAMPGSLGTQRRICK